MNPLEKFLDEHSSLTGGSEAEASAPVKSARKTGSLLLTGCIDWDNLASKTAVGLEVPHKVDSLGSEVMCTYSSSSSYHMFILCGDGKLYGMGKNDRGQLGNGNKDTTHLPCEVPLPWRANQLKKVALGRSHSLFLLTNGDVYGCGSNGCGQLGLGGGVRDQQDSTSIKKLPLSHIRDIACGYDHSLACNEDGHLITFGHPQYGQLGLGSTGEHLQEGKRGVQFDFITSPQRVTRLTTADGKSGLRADEVRFRSVHAGKNHSIAVEDWEADDGSGEEKMSNRVFSWGFGGYGRLGHNGATDEFYPREIATFTSDRPFPQKQVREVYCGSTYTLAISKSRHLYFCGILPNSPRKEATTRPTVQQELYAWTTHIASGGSSWVVVAADDACVFWGVPAAGKFGLEDDARSSAAPKFVAAVSGMQVSDISCGYGHIAMVVAHGDGADKKGNDPLEAFDALSDAVSAQTCFSPSAEPATQAAGKGGKKRAAPAKKGPQKASKKGKK